MTALNDTRVKGELMRVTGELRLEQWIAKRARQRLGSDECPITERNHGRDDDPQKMTIASWPANDEVMPC